jgi:hypothetical protein
VCRLKQDDEADHNADPHDNRPRSRREAYIHGEKRRAKLPGRIEPPFRSQTAQQLSDSSMTC